MSDIEKLKQLVAAHRSGKRRHFPEVLKNQILEAAKKHGNNLVIKALGLSPSSFYKWSKRPKSKPRRENSKAMAFVEIPRPQEEGVWTGVKWEAVRPDGAILRCELSGQRPEIGSVIAGFLNGRGAS